MDFRTLCSKVSFAYFRLSNCRLISVMFPLKPFEITVDAADDKFVSPEKEARFEVLLEDLLVEAVVVVSCGWGIETVV